MTCKAVSINLTTFLVMGCYGDSLCLSITLIAALIRVSYLKIYIHCVESVRKIPRVYVGQQMQYAESVS